MIHLVTPENAALYAAQLKAMHRHRREVFVDKLKWDLPIAEDGGEYDAYDDDEAIYLMGLDPKGEIECCVRLRPTANGSIIGDSFPDAIMAGEPADAPGTWEMSRYYARGAALTNAGFLRRSQMRLAAIEAAHAAGVRRIVALTEIFFWEPIMRSGWKVKALGLPFAYGAGGEAIAFEISCRPEDAAYMRERLNLSSHTLELPMPASGDIAPQDLEQLLTSMDQMSDRDQQVMGDVVRRLATIENEQGEAVALAVAEQMENVICDRVAV